MVAFQSVQFFLLAKDRHPRLIVGSGDIRDQSPLETGAQPCFKSLNVFRRLITGDNDLLSGYMQMVESMEELFLSTLLTYYKLDIIDKEYIIASVLLTECGHCQLIPVLTYLQSVDQFIGKCLTGHIEHFLGRVMLQYIMGDRMHQMSFT